MQLPSEILVVHSQPERVTQLFDTMRDVGQSVVTATTARDAFSILEGAADRIRRQRRERVAEPVGEVKCDAA